MRVPRKIFNLEMLSAQLLLLATILALLISNSPLNKHYITLFHSYYWAHYGQLTFRYNLLAVINEGLMTVFFLVISLEIKYELLNGTLNSIRKAALPGIGAIGGMLVPAAVYLAINHNDKNMLQGWAIPTATDIAFALAILALLGSRIKTSLKVFLTALAIFDDLAAIIIIALFYSGQLSLTFLSLAVVCIGLLLILNRLGNTHFSLYASIGFLLWGCLLQSGVHATLAGVILAFMVPLKNKVNSRLSTLEIVQRKLQPWVALVILPLFAFANAGISLVSLRIENLHTTLVLGVLLGLFVGKQLGIFGATWLAVRLGIATRPAAMLWTELYAVAIICGIGFTMSLFIGSLAFNNLDSSYLNSIKWGILMGSLLSGCMGYVLLRLINRTSKTKYSDKLLETTGTESSITHLKL